MWIARTPNGPSVKCHVQNIHTMDELKMTGNCLKGSRGIVCFDGGWDQDEHWRLLKEMITHVSTPASAQYRLILTTILQQTFSVPKTSRKLKPFIDHILTFSLLDNKIWFRNFQIVEKDPLKPSGPPQTSLVEIGPRFVLTPIRIFEGSFGGPTVFENPGTQPHHPAFDISLTCLRVRRIHLPRCYTCIHQASPGPKVPSTSRSVIRQGGEDRSAARGFGRGRVGEGSGVCLDVVAREVGCALMDVSYAYCSCSPNVGLSTAYSMGLVCVALLRTIRTTHAPT